MRKLLALLIALVALPIQAQVTASKPGAGALINCSNPQAPDSAYVFTDVSTGTPSTGATVTDNGCGSGHNLTITNTNSHITVVNDGTFGHVLRFTGVNTTDLASVASNLGASTDVMMAVAYRVNSTTNPTAINNLIGLGNTASGTSAGVAIPASNGRVQQRRIHTSQTAIVTTYSTTDYADNAVHLAVLKAQDDPAGGIVGGATSVDGGAFTTATDANALSFAGVMNQFGIGAEMRGTKTNFVGDATVTIDIIAVFVWANKGFSSYDDTFVSAVYNSGDPWAGIGLGSCTGTPSISTVDVDNRFSSTQTNIAVTGTNFCNSGTMEITQNGHTWQQKTGAWTNTLAYFDATGIGAGIQGGLLYGETGSNDLTLKLINASNNFGTKAIAVFPGSPSGIQIDSTANAVGTVVSGAGGCGCGTLAPGAPSVLPDKTKLIAVTVVRSETEDVDIPGWSTLLKAPEEAFDIECHVYRTGDSMPTFDWDGTGFSQAAIFGITGGPDTCEDLVESSSIVPRDQAVANFPFPAASVPSSGSVIFRTGLKVKSSAGNGVTVDTVAGFQRLWTRCPNGAATCFVGEIQVQEAAAGVPAGSWTFPDVTKVETQESAAVTIVFKGGSPICFDLDGSGLAPLALTSGDKLNRLNPSPDLEADSQVAVMGVRGPGSVSDITVDNDASISSISDLNSVLYDYSRNGLYTGSPQQETLSGTPPTQGGDTINVHKTLRPNPDGTYTEAYPCTLTDRSDCAPPAVPTLSCSLTGFPSLINLQTGGASFSQSIRAQFSGSASGTATILGPVDISGDASATKLWSVSGNNLINPLTNPTSIGSGVFKFGGRTSGNDVYCDPVTWSIIAPLGTDVTAPNPVTGFSVTATTSSTIDTAFDSTIDPSANRSGVASYRVKRNGSTIGTLTAANPGLSVDLTTVNIGSGSGTHTCTRSGAQWTLVGGGAGIDGTSDQTLFCDQAVSVGSNGVDIIVQLSSLTTPAIYSKAFLELRNSNDPTSQAANCTFMISGGSLKFQTRNRLTGGGSRVTTVNQTLATSVPKYGRLHYDAANGLDCDYGDDGTNWTHLATDVAISLPSVVMAGVGATPTNNGSTITAVFPFVSINNVGVLTKTATGVTSGAATFTLTAVDVAGNESSALAGVSATLVGSAPAVRWHPGHYIRTLGNHAASGAGQDSYINGVINTYSKLSENSHLKGVHVNLAWGTLNPSGSTISFSRLDQILDALPSGYKLILCVSYKSFGTTDLGVLVPTDLASSVTARHNTGGTVVGYTANVWDSTVMSRLMTVYQAIGAVYDDDPRLEMVTTDESSPGIAVGTNGYTQEGLAAQLIRLYGAMAGAFKKTNLVANMNSLVGQGANLIEQAYLLKMGRASPDSINDPGALVFKGDQVTSPNQGTTIRDYRGLVPHETIASSSSLGGANDNGPPATLIDWAQVESITHLPWVTNITSPAADNWTAIKAAINADPNLFTTCPTQYPSCDTTP